MEEIGLLVVLDLERDADRVFHASGSPWNVAPHALAVTV
jgi:hypothetical protein